MTPDNEIVAVALDGVRDNLKTHDTLMPTFFIGSGGKLLIIGVLFGDDKQKDAAAALVKRKIAELNADFVLFVAESWTIKDQEAAKEFMQNRDAYPSVSSHPKASEVVMLALETKHRHWLATPDILPQRMLGSVDWQELGADSLMGGRFAKFFSGDKPVIN